MGLGWVASGTSPGLGIALVSFALAGFGNGLLLVHERLLIQAVVPENLQGRIFAVSDTVVSWAFAIAFLGAGPLLGGARREGDDRNRRRGRAPVRRSGDVRAAQRVDRVPASPAGHRHASLRSGSDLLALLGAGQHRADVVGGGCLGGARLHDSQHRRDDLRIELGAGVRRPARRSPARAGAPRGRGEWWSSRCRRRRRTRRARGAGSPRPAGRPGSPCRPSARGTSARPRRPAPAGRRCGRA